MRWRVVQSSEPGAVERDRAIWALVERAVLTRLVVRELLESPDPPTGRRPVTALDLLLAWVSRSFPDSVKVEPHPTDGLDLMVVPEGFEPLHREIEDGARVCELLFFALTADTPIDLRNDLVRLKEAMNRYAAQHPDPAAAR
jgi:hypothetical protein